MKIDEACINHNAVRIIGELSENIYSFCDGDTGQNRMYMAMTLGEIAGVIEMVDVLKEALKA
jgi:hypothetical protein